MIKRLGTIQLGFTLICFMLTILGCQNMGGKTDVGGNYNGVVVKAEVDHNRLAANVPVHIKATVTNTGNRVAVIESSDTPVFDILIQNVSSHKLYTAWSLQHPDEITHRLELQPGETHTLALEWVPPEEEFIPGQVIGVDGVIYEASRIRQGAGFLLCMKYC